MSFSQVRAHRADGRPQTCDVAWGESWVGLGVVVAGVVFVVFWEEGVFV